VKRTVIILILQVITLSSAYADQKRVMTSYGTGNESCGSFLSALSKTPIDRSISYEGMDYASESRVYTEWLVGYVTAFNAFNDQKKNIQNIDVESAAYWLKNYCEAHPLSRVSSAAWALVIEQGGFDIKRYK